MDYAGIFLGGLILLGVVSDRVLKKVSESGRQFPWCRTCGKNMVKIPVPRYLPEGVRRHLDRYGLPPVVVSRFVCPKGDYQLWYIPKFGGTEKAFFLREDM